MATRNLVLCLDGTWNSTYDEKKRDDGHKVLKPSNVLKLARAVPPRSDDGSCEQLTYYDTGVGSLAEYPGVSNRLLHFSDRIFGGAWGAGFEGNVEDALGFLVNNHRPEDRVFVFGFSRGAATARALTQFLEWAGGLPTKRDAYYLPRFFRAYVVDRGTRPCAEAVAEINARRTGKRRLLDPFQKIDVVLLGVWDTVMSLGGRFRATGESTSVEERSYHVRPRPALCVRHARQALAVDEVRYDFRPDVWTEKHSESPEQTLEQRWFPGVHSNVGGGYVDDGLANVALHWILKEARALGLEIDKDFTKFYPAFPMDRLYRSESALYRVLDRVRRRYGRGKRRLVDRPATAGLTLDRSVIHRIVADPEEKKKDGTPRFPDMQGKKYRPENVLQLLAREDDLDAYLEGLGLPPEQRQLPADVIDRIEQLR